jgi:hypothetical protein
MKITAEKKDKIRAISLWQPWAGALAVGIKTVETRPWQTKVRGDLLICSAKKVVQPFFYPNNYEDVVSDCNPKERDLLEIKGHALCIVEIVDCISTNDRDFIESLSREEIMWGDYSYNRYAWVTKNLRRIKPIPVKGSQGFYFVDKQNIQEI